MFLTVPAMLRCMSGFSDRLASQRSNAEVGERVRARRIELGLTPSDVTAAADIDPKTLQGLEDGLRWPIERSRRRLEPVLQWRSGDLDVIKDGGEPTVQLTGTDTGIGEDTGAVVISPTGIPSRAAVGTPTVTRGFEHPMLNPNTSIAEIADQLNKMLDVVDGTQATHRQILEQIRALEQATPGNSATPSELERSLHEAQLGTSEYRAFLADLLFQVMTAADASNVEEVRTFIRPLYDRAVKGLPSPQNEAPQAPLDVDIHAQHPDVSPLDEAATSQPSDNVTRPNQSQIAAARAHVDGLFRSGRVSPESGDKESQKRG